MLTSKFDKDPTPEDKKKIILNKAIFRVAEQLRISRGELSIILGISEPSLSRYSSSNNNYINPSSKEGHLAVLLIRLYQSLDTFFGGNTHQCQLWLRSENKHLKNKPIELIKSIEGLVLTVQYLEAM